MNTESRVPNDQQIRFGALPVAEVLLTAPAGCGKTVALAGRAAAVLRRGEVCLPQRILAVTFSNNAKRNLAVRMRTLVGGMWPRAVTVTNFHGLAARVIRAHGDALGLPRELGFPERRWRNRTLRSLGVNYANAEPFEAALRAAKGRPVDDEVVMAELVKTANAKAIAFEEHLRSEGRLDYDDLIRHAARLLEIPEIARLYKAHFGMVLVDEVQDLTLMQIALVEAVGGDRITFAGDPAQGIYSFAGAQPLEVFERIRAREPILIEFDESYRSSPAVLGAVNILANMMGAIQLRSADHVEWPDPGHVLQLKSATPNEEAEALVHFLSELLDRNPQTTIGVVVRRNTRLVALRRVAADAQMPFEDWGAPTHVPKAVELLKRFVSQAASTDLTPGDQLALLEEMCRAQLDESDVDGMDDIASACEELRTLLDDGTDLAAAVATCRHAPAVDKAVTPGVHFLTGHIGKGQEFDWVVVLGLEDGHIPDFRAREEDGSVDEELRVLHVMVSRARYGLVLAVASTSSTRVGLRPATPSRWLNDLEPAITGTVDSWFAQHAVGSQPT